MTKASLGTGFLTTSKLVKKDKQSNVLLENSVIATLRNTSRSYGPALIVPRKKRVDERASAWRRTGNLRVHLKGAHDCTGLTTKMKEDVTCGFCLKLITKWEKRG
jgi:hypothetical protein